MPSLHTAPVGAGLHRPSPSGPGPGDRIRLARQQLRRRNLARRLLSIAVGLAAVAAARSLPAGDDAGAALVPVAVRDLAPGEIVTSADVGSAPLPPGLAAAAVAVDPLGRAIRSPVYAGEVLLDARLGAGGGVGLGPDERAVALTRPLAVPPLAAGDQVELVAVTAGGPAGAIAQRLAPAARVLAFDAESVTVAVPAEAAAKLVGHHAAGPVEIVLTPWTG